MYKRQDTDSRNWPAICVALFGKLCITFSFAVVYLYSAELFPTEIRTTGIGSCSTVGRLGGILAPFVGDLAKPHNLDNPYIPVVIFGLSALLAGIVSLKLPETKGRKLPDTVEEAEQLPLATLALPVSWRRNRSR